jgi:hypothetical protein
MERKIDAFGRDPEVVLHCGLPARPTQSGTLNHRAGGGNRRNAAIAVRVCRNNACGTITSAIWNLCDPQPQLRARFTGGAASILVDFGTATPIKAVALISTNLSTNATARWRLGTLEVPDAAHDSGILPAHTATRPTATSCCCAAVWPPRATCWSMSPMPR